jgi:hypothetical protein
VLIVTASQRLFRRAIIPTSENDGDAGTPLPLIAPTAQLQLSVRRVDSQQNVTPSDLIQTVRSFLLSKARFSN